MSMFEKYTESILGPREHLVYMARESKWVYFWYFVGTVFFLAGAPFVIRIMQDFFKIQWLNIWEILGYSWAIGLLIFYAFYAQHQTTELAITTQRVVYKTGFYAREAIEMNLYDVVNINISETGNTRMLGFGDIKINGAGTTIIAEDISDPLKFRKMLTLMQDPQANQEFVAGQQSTQYFNNSQTDS